MTLQPGSYTVNVASVSGGSGSALAEVYDVTDLAASSTCTGCADQPGQPGHVDNADHDDDHHHHDDVDDLDPGSSPADTVWFENAAPAGAQQISGAGGEGLTWVASNSEPGGGHPVRPVHPPGGGLHDHFFNYASATLSVGANDTLFAYVPQPGQSTERDHAQLERRARRGNTAHSGGPTR